MFLFWVRLQPSLHIRWLAIPQTSARWRLVQMAPSYLARGMREYFAVSMTDFPYLLWDRTARVWQGFQEMFVLKGHTLSVLAVLVVDIAQTLTASADKTIQLWEQSKPVKKYTGHTDAVRGLALIPNIGFASCSNDRFVSHISFAP